jgi:molybdate transport system regulatory protein
MSANPSLKIIVRLYCGKEIAMGPGKADLLDAIARYGSISAAGRAMGMSYRRAWLLVDTMNRCWAEPLVAATPGSGQSGGARLTAMGTQVLAQFRKLQHELAEAAQDPAQTAQTALAALLDAPRASQRD